MNALWKEPVTTAASTTLAHLLVPATEGTHSMASPTVAVSGPLWELAPGSRATLEVYLPIWDKECIRGQWQQEKKPLKRYVNINLPQ